MAQQDKSWESAWKSALENKTAAPPQGVWENIEDELNKSSQRKLLPLWWAAAAAVTIIAVSGVLINETFYTEKLETPPIALSLDKVEGANDLINTDRDQTSKQKGDNVSTPIESVPETKTDKTVIQSLDQSYAVQSANEEQTSVYDFLPSLIDRMRFKLAEVELPAIPEVWGVALPVVANPSKDEEIKNSWFAGIDLSAGTSTMDGSIVNSDRREFSASPLAGYSASNTVESVSSSASYGVAVGRKLSKKVIIESGISYRRIENTGESNLAFVSPEGRSAFNSNAISDQLQVATTSPYEIQHVHQFISVPVKAGYLLMDKKWKMSLNAGIAGDYFFKTHSEDVTGNLERYESNPAADPRWNSMTMSVLGGVNMSRTLGENYIIVISPEVRQSLSDFSNTNEELRPFILQLGVQFRYKFN